MRSDKCLQQLTVITTIFAFCLRGLTALRVTMNGNAPVVGAIWGVCGNTPSCRPPFLSYILTVSPYNRPPATNASSIAPGSTQSITTATVSVDEFPTLTNVVLTVSFVCGGTDIPGCSGTRSKVASTYQTISAWKNELLEGVTSETQITFEELSHSEFSLNVSFNYAYSVQSGITDNCTDAIVDDIYCPKEFPYSCQIFATSAASSAPCCNEAFHPTCRSLLEQSTTTTVCPTVTCPSPAPTTTSTTPPVSITTTSSDTTPYSNAASDTASDITTSPNNSTTEQSTSASSSSPATSNPNSCSDSQETVYFDVMIAFVVLTALLLIALIILAVFYTRSEKQKTAVKEQLRRNIRSSSTQPANTNLTSTDHNTTESEAPYYSRPKKTPKPTPPYRPPGNEYQMDMDENPTNNVYPTMSKEARV